MADEPENKVNSQGATSENLDPGQTRQGAPVAPADSGNEPPKQEPTPEQKKAAEDAEKARIADAERIEQERLAAEAKEAEEAAKKAAEAKEKQELTEYIAIDDPSATAAIDLLKEAGVTPTEANAIFAKAIESGDLADIDVAALEAKLGKAKATLVMAGVQDYYGRQTENNAAATKAVYEIMGGEKGWETVKTWAQAKEKADPGFKKSLNEIRKLLDAGGLQSELGGRELLRLFNADPDTKGLNSGDITRGDGLGRGAGAPMSRAEYIEAYEAAHKRGASSTELAALNARRRAGKAAGI